jgi:carotenoid cleavage dioxygenase
VADAAGVLVRSVDVPLERPVMMHDFVMTERHVVFFDLPAIFDFEGMMSGGTAVRWEPESGARIGVLPRGASGDTAGDAITWIDVDPFYIFHFMNGWDDGDTVVVDGCRSSALPVSFGDAPPPASAARATLHRWTIDLAAGRVTTTQLDDRFADFPRVAPSVEGRPYRFGYVGHAGTSDVAGITQFDGLTVWDFERDSSVSYRYGDDVFCGEAVFAPDPRGTAENDGWLLNFVSQLDDRSTRFVILDARDVEAGPVASVEIPRRVPFGFHGSWMPDLIP